MAGVAPSRLAASRTGRPLTGASRLSGTIRSGLPSLPALHAGSGQASSYSFGDPGPFEFRNGTENVELQPSGWCGGIDAFG